jgi:hypothetical protein
MTAALGWADEVAERAATDADAGAEEAAFVALGPLVDVGPTDAPADALEDPDRGADRGRPLDEGADRADEPGAAVPEPAAAEPLPGAAVAGAAVAGTAGDSLASALRMVSSDDSFAAAVPDPVGPVAPCNVLVESVPTVIAAVARATVTAPAAARLRRGRSPTIRPRRSGSSTSACVTAASTIATPTSANRASKGRGAPAATAGITSNGQCQR